MNNFYIYSLKQTVMKKNLLLGFFFLFVSVQMLKAQTVYKNGILGTGTLSASGVASPAGFAWSECQAVGSVANTNAGSTTVYNNALTTNFRLADNFTVPAIGQAWSVSQVSVYAYQTGSPASPSPFDVLRVEIWNGDPSAGGSAVVFGDMTTNRLSSSVDSLTYRIFSSTTPAPGTATGTTRKIWKLNANVTGVTLNAGTYWLVWQLHATNDAVAYAPPCNVVGVRGLAGWNAKQFNGSTSTWADITDAGNPATPPNVPMDLPFEITYTNTLPVTFITFSGTKQNAINNLSWTTSTEQNNSGFYIERSADGKNFSSLEFVASKATNGNSTSNLSYVFNDEKPLKGTSYYRLKQLDKDGKSSLSNIVVINGNKVANIELSNLYPNPVKDKLNLVISNEINRKVDFVITDLMGKIVLTLSQTISSGDSNIQLNVEKLASGSYILKAVCNDGCESSLRKFVKQ